jgi:hydroxyacylglutathione hydrolase
VQATLAQVEQMRGRDEITVPSRLGHERRINPFLRSREADVRASAEQHAGRTLATPVEVFASVRQWKDGFR